MSLIELCHCGHDVDTHYRDPTTRARYGCTGIRCDCSLYLNRDTPEAQATRDKTYAVRGAT